MDMKAGSHPFRSLATTSEGYATMPVEDAFTWQACLADALPGEWYMVAFRSVRRPGVDEARLTAHDDLAHAEAQGAPGFVHYFKGPTNAPGECMSFCLWTSRADARAAAGRPNHVEAVALTFDSYVSYELEFHRIRRVAGEPRFVIERYDPVGGFPPDESPERSAESTPGGFASQPAFS